MARPAKRQRTPLLLMAAVGVILVAILVLSRRADAVNSTVSVRVYYLEKIAERSVEEIIVPPQEEIRRERKARSLEESTIEEDEREGSGRTGDGELPALKTVVVTESRPSSQTVVPEENNNRQHQDWGLHEVVVGNNDSVVDKADTEGHSLPLPTGEEYRTPQDKWNSTLFESSTRSHFV